MAETAQPAPHGRSGPIDGPGPPSGTLGDARVEAPESVGSSTKISNGIVALHKQYMGRGPTAVRTHFVGDLVIVVLAGGFSAGERTLAREGHADVVLEQRRAFQLVMAERFKSLVREAVGREIIAMLSANHVDPDLAVETFVLGDRVRDSEDTAAG